MDDARVWSFERDLWIGDAELYARSIDDACLMVLARPPFILTGAEAVDAVSATPRWLDVEFSEQRISRPQEGLLVAAYRVRASTPEVESFEAHCSTTYRRLAHEEWRVVQHQQAAAPLA
ncbi:MAG TPA: DUF4440 domain-containing protein [Allosphingosinicella sp.]|nr:DUF4440 domain-containing protein [Allosphingosinicella sp.]